MTVSLADLDKWETKLASGWRPRVASVRKLIALAREALQHRDAKAERPMPRYGTARETPPITDLSPLPVRMAETKDLRDEVVLRPVLTGVDYSETERQLMMSLFKVKL